MKRFRGPLTTSWTRSRDNQVGPDADVGTDPSGTPYTIYRTTNIIHSDNTVTDGDDTIFVFSINPIITDSLISKTLYTFEYDSYHTIASTYANSSIVCTTGSAGPLNSTRCVIETEKSIHVSKLGNDASNGHKLTIQAAIDEAISQSYTKVIVLDSGTYIEKLDLKGIHVEAYPGQSPTIKFPALGFSGTATGLTAPSVTAFAEFTYNGAPCLYASTGDGLWRTLDGMAWTQTSLDNKSLTGCCVWNGLLYVANTTDSQLDTYTDDYTHATISAATMGISFNTINGGVWNFGKYLYVDVADVTDRAIFDGATWTNPIDTISPGAVGFYHAIYDQSISTDTVIAIEATTGTNPYLYIMNASDCLQKIPSVKTYAFRVLSTIDGKYCAANDTGFYLLYDVNDPANWTMVSAHGVTSPRGIAKDNRGYVYIFGTSTYAISKDNGITWYTYGTAPSVKTTYAPAAFFRGVGMVAKATGIAYEDMVHVRGAGSINGCYVDGIGVLSQALEFVRLSASQTFTYCDVSGHYNGTVDFADATFAISNSRLHDMHNCAIGISHFGKNNHIHSITNIAKQASGQTATDDDCTIERCGYGIISESTYGAEDSIIYGNNVDFVETAAALSPAFTDTVVGVVVSTQAGTYTNCSRANPLLLTDGDVKDKAGGYPYDSVALALGAGCYKITRTSSTAYSIDAHIAKVPTGETLIWNVSNYQSNENANGEYSETWDGLKRRIELSWDAEQFADNTQLGRLLDVYRQEDAVFQYGESDGTNWTPKMSGACTCAGSVATITATTANVGKNEFAGYWVKIGTTYHRITSHPEAALGDSLALTLDTAPTGTSYSIDYILVKIDKGTAFQATQYLTSSRVVTGYSLTLREVDSE